MVLLLPAHSAQVQPFYEGQTIRLALGTQSRDIARMRRDELVEADDAYWAQLKLSLDLEKAGQTMDTVHARKRYEIAKARAMAAGYTYRPVDQLADPSQIEDIVRRILTVEQQAASDGRLNEAVVDAVLGGVDEPKITVSEAMDICKTKIALGLLSDNHHGRWRQPFWPVGLNGRRALLYTLSLQDRFSSNTKPDHIIPEQE